MDRHFQSRQPLLDQYHYYTKRNFPRKCISSAERISVAEAASPFKSRHDSARYKLENQAKRSFQRDKTNRQAAERGRSQRSEAREAPRRARRARGPDRLARKWKHDQDISTGQQSKLVASTSTTEFRIPSPTSPFYEADSRFETSSPEPADVELSSPTSCEGIDIVPNAKQIHNVSDAVYAQHTPSGNCGDESMELETEEEAESTWLQLPEVASKNSGTTMDNTCGSGKYCLAPVYNTALKTETGPVSEHGLMKSHEDLDESDCMLDEEADIASCWPHSVSQRSKHFTSPTEKTSDTSSGPVRKNEARYREMCKVEPIRAVPCGIRSDNHCDVKSLSGNVHETSDDERSATRNDEVSPSVSCGHDAKSEHNVTHDESCLTAEPPDRRDDCRDAGTSNPQVSPQIPVDEQFRHDPSHSDTSPQKEERSTSPCDCSAIVNAAKIVQEMMQEITQHTAGIAAEAGCTADLPLKKARQVAVDSPKSPPMGTTNRYGLSFEDDVPMSAYETHKTLHLESSRLDDSVSDAGGVDRTSSYLLQEDGAQLGLDADCSSDFPVESISSIQSVQESSSSFFDEDEHKNDPDGPLWRQNFLGQCVLLVERRFENAYANTCMKPLCAQFPNVYEDTDEAQRLPTSELPHHQQVTSMTDFELSKRQPFNQQETKQVVCNFINVAMAFRMKFPYLLAGIQTGLETKREIFIFSKFKDEHRVFAKLCFGLSKRMVLECIDHLRVVLPSDLATEDPLELEVLVNRLFVGFGPDWLTIARLTGINQRAIKDILIQTNNMNPYEPPQWSVVHECLLKEKRYAPRPSRRGPSPEIPWRPQSSNLHTTMSCIGGRATNSSVCGKTLLDAENCAADTEPPLTGTPAPCDGRIANRKRAHSISLKQNTTVQSAGSNGEPLFRVPTISFSGMTSNTTTCRETKPGQPAMTRQRDQSLSTNQAKQDDNLLRIPPRTTNDLGQKRSTVPKEGAAPSAPPSTLQPIADATNATKRKRLASIIDLQHKPIRPVSALSQRSYSQLKHLLENGDIHQSLGTNLRSSIGVVDPPGTTHVVSAEQADAVADPPKPPLRNAAEVQQKSVVPVVRLKSPMGTRRGKRSHCIADLDSSLPARGASTRKTRRISLWHCERRTDKSDVNEAT